MCSKDFVKDIWMLSTALKIISMAEFKGLTNVSLKQLVTALIANLSRILQNQ